MLGTAFEPRPGCLVGGQDGVVCENFISETAQAGFARAIYWRLSVREGVPEKMEMNLRRGEKPNRIAKEFGSSLTVLGAIEEWET